MFIFHKAGIVRVVRGSAKGDSVAQFEKGFGLRKEEHVLGQMVLAAIAQFVASLD